MPCVAEVVNRSLKADCTDFIKDEVLIANLSPAQAPVTRMRFQTPLCNRPPGINLIKG